jgi:hypothetical protein
MVSCLGCGQSMAERAGIPVCSDACRQRERRARRRRSRRAICADCGGVFVPSRSDAQYCSLTCKEHSHRRRKSAIGKPETAQERLSTPFGPPNTAAKPPGANSDAFDDLRAALNRGGGANDNGVGGGDNGGGGGGGDDDFFRSPRARSRMDKRAGNRDPRPRRHIQRDGIRRGMERHRRSKSAVCTAIAETGRTAGTDHNSASCAEPSPQPRLNSYKNPGTQGFSVLLVGLNRTV